MEKRERRDRQRRSQLMKQRHGGGSQYSSNECRDKRGTRDNRDTRDNRGTRDNRDSVEKDKVAPKPAVEEKKVIDHTAIPDPHMFDNLKRETDDIAALKTKQHGKRQIFSNWAKYDIEPEDDEQQIGDDYGSLLESAQIGSQFQLKSDRIWDPKRLPAQSAAFTIDLGVLASSLACLPLYEKLDVPLDMFTDEELMRMDHQAQSARANWEQNRAGKGVLKEGLSIDGSLLEELSDIPSEKLISKVQSFGADVLSGGRAAKSAEHTPEREQTPDCGAKQSFDFGVIPTRGSSENVAAFRKERSVGPSAVTVIKETSPKLEEPPPPMEEVPVFEETKMEPPSPTEEVPVFKETKIVPPPSMEEVPMFEETKKEPSPSMEESPTFEETRQDPTPEPCTVAAEESVVEPPPPQPSPVMLQAPLEEKVHVAEGPREVQGRRKSRGARNKGNKRRSWDQENEESCAAQPSSTPLPEQRPTSPSYHPQPAQWVVSDGVSKETANLNDPEEKHISQVPDAVEEHPESPRPPVLAYEKKEKPRRGGKLREPQKPEHTVSAMGDAPQREEYSQEVPKPLAVPKEKPRHSEGKREFPQAVPEAKVQRSTPPPRDEPPPPVVNNKPQADLKTKDVPQPSVVSPLKKDDDQLDFLLSLRKPVGSQHVMNFAAPTTAVRAAIDEDEPALQPPEPEKKTEDLEDWLDSMLDD